MSGIGVRLRQERNRLKLSQSALGAIGGVETNAQGNYESGARSPKTSYLLRIAEAGVDLNYVLTGVRTDKTNAANEGDGAGLKPVVDHHLHKVTDQLHRNLYGLIDALYQMAQLKFCPSPVKAFPGESMPGMMTKISSMEVLR